MEKWPINNFSDFLEEERKNCYWFWFKGKITRRKNIDTGEIYEQNLSGKCEWNGIRLQNGFNHCFNILTIDNSGWIIPSVSPFDAVHRYNRSFGSNYYDFYTKKVLQ